MAKDFCILHMSDAHFGIRDNHGQQRAVAKAQIEAAHKAGFVPDLCVFSGDIAQSSEPEQLAQGEAFLKMLLAPWPNAALVVVPGNHDIVRRHTDAAFFRAIAADSDIYHGWKRTSGTKLGQFDAYFGWHQQAKTQMPLISEWHARKPYAFRQSFKWDNMPVHVIGVNSSLFCCDNMDEGKLVIDVKSLRDELDTACDVGGLILAISHHPLSSLVAWNRDIVQQNLKQAQGAHVLLHGHLHKQEGSEESNTTGQQLAVLGAGASFQGKDLMGNSFAFYKVCFNDNKIKSHVLEYSSNSGNWHHDGSRSHDIYVGIPRPSSTLAAAARQLPALGDLLPKRNKSKKGRAKNEPNDARIEQLRDDSQAVLAVLVPKIHEALIERASPSERCYAIRSRTKSRERIADIIRSVGQDDIAKALSRIPDVCGLRVVTAYQSQVPSTVARLISLIENDFNSDPNLNFSNDVPIDLEITEPRPEGEHSELSDAIRLAIQDFARLPEPTRRNRGEFAMVTITARVIRPGKRGEVLPVEIQVRSGMEDVGAELDDRLRYGRGNGEGVSWMKHLNVLRGLIDGLVGYVDVIQKHAQDDPVVVPSSSVQVKSVLSSREQLALFPDLPDEVRIKLEYAYGIWEQAQHSRGSQGGMPGLFRHAADAFGNVHHDLSRYSESETWKAPLSFLVKTEQAYMLLNTGDKEDERVAEIIYRELLRERPNDTASNYRLSGILREKGEFTEALERITSALEMIERGDDKVITTEHWIYDEVRRVFATTYWRMSEAAGTDKEKQRELLAKAIEHSCAVVRKPADPDFRLSAINDSLYYNWEYINLAEGDQSLIEEQELEELRNLLFEHYQTEKANSDNLGWHWLDTLARLFRDDRAKVKEIALHFEHVIEQRAKMIRPALQLAPRGNRQWNAQLSQLLSKDEVDSLVFCQEILDEIGR